MSNTKMSDSLLRPDGIGSSHYMTEAPTRTSCIDFISSVHGEQRRRERDVSKRDLQAAVKHGTREPTQNPQTREPRWKYTFADVVYITDKTSTKEVTSWALPLPLQKVPLRISSGATSPSEHSGLLTTTAASLSSWREWWQQQMLQAVMQFSPAAL